MTWQCTVLTKPNNNVVTSYHILQPKINQIRPSHRFRNIGGAVLEFKMGFKKHTFYHLV